MILGTAAIRERLERGEIFLRDTWNPNCIKEASYTLRVAGDGLMIDGRSYPPGDNFPNSFITIEPGKIAILSTIERLSMPNDIVGHPGIRLNYAAQGLTGLMGIQVDPGYGVGVSNERLFLRVANLGNEDVRFRLGEAVFNIQFQQIDGAIETTSRTPTWDRLMDALIRQSEPSWTYVTQVQAQTERVRTELETRAGDMKEDLAVRIEDVRQGMQPLILFGVFLIAATLLGVVMAVLLTFEDTSSAEVPAWVTNWGWILLAGFISLAALATTAIGISAAVVFYVDAKKSWNARARQDDV